MIDYIDRDYTISSKTQKKAILKEYESNGKEVLLVSSIANGCNRGKIQVMWKWR